MRQLLVVIVVWVGFISPTWAEMSAEALAEARKYLGCLDSAADTFALVPASIEALLVGIFETCRTQKGAAMQAYCSHERSEAGKPPVHRPDDGVCLSGFEFVRELGKGRHSKLTLRIIVKRAERLR